VPYVASASWAAAIVSGCVANPRWLYEPRLMIGRLAEDEIGEAQPLGWQFGHGRSFFRSPKEASG